MRRALPLLLLVLVACRSQLQPVGSSAAPGDMAMATSGDMLPALAFVYRPMDVKQACHSLRNADLGDFNFDGKLDLVGFDEGSIDGGPIPRLCQGKGDGTFFPAGGFGPSPSASCVPDFGNVRALDLDGDGQLEVVYSLTDCSATPLQLRATNLSGAVQPPDRKLVGAPASSSSSKVLAPWDFDSADFDRDGHVDLVIAGGGLTEVLMNAGDGSFVLGNPSATLAWARAGDFDGDGSADLVGGGGRDGCALELLRNQGSTPFATYSPIADFSCEPVHVADLDGDGALDLIVPVVAPTALAPTAELHVVLSHGGIFTNPMPLTVPSPVAPGPADQANVARQSDFALADFDGDGKLDLAVVAEALTVLRGDGHGGFRPLGTLAPVAAQRPGRVQAGDVDGDGRPDVVIAGAVYLNRLPL